MNFVLNSMVNNLRSEPPKFAFQNTSSGYHLQFIFVNIFATAAGWPFTQTKNYDVFLSSGEEDNKWVEKAIHSSFSYKIQVFIFVI